jgi:hypothetical protein
MVSGKVHSLLGQVVDVINPAEPKAKSHRYLVKDVTRLTLRGGKNHE